MFLEHEVNKNVTVYKVDEFFKMPLEVVKETSSQGLLLFVNFKKDQENEYSSVLDDYNIQTKKEHTIIDLVNNDVGVSQIKENTYKQFIQIAITKEFLKDNLSLNKNTEKIFEFFEKPKTIENLSYKKTDYKSQCIAHEIFNNELEKDLGKLFLESKVLELLYVEFSKLIYNDEKVNPKVKLNKEDKEAIFYAKEILSQRIENPPSIKELSRIVALNELKLKTGFHHFFKDTPYNISLEYRLKKAKTLLETSEYNVNEIASKIGYKYVQSFSNTFYKRFGVRPKDIMKTRKYYY